MSLHSKITWLLVADGATAQFYKVHAIPLRLSKVPAGVIKSSRRIGHAPDHQRQEDVFVEQIAETLRIAAHDSEFHDIIVVLPPRALARFREVAAPGLQKRIKQEITGDWTHLETPVLEKHLAANMI